MKTLANCTPTEFLIQTNRIRKAASKWLTLTKILEIRKTVPERQGETAEEKREIMKEQINANLGAMLDAILDEHPQETAELLGLVCFVEPQDLSKHKMSEFLGAIGELISTPEVLDFFISLAQLGKLTTSV